MKVFRISTVLFILSIFTLSCINIGVNGNGKIITENRTISSDFTKIKVSQGITVLLTQSKYVTIKAEMDENILDLLITEVQDGTLDISFKENVNNRTISRIYLSMPVITKLTVSSGAEINSFGLLEASDINISASSGGDINANIKSQNINCDMSSGSQIELSGESELLNINCSSGSKADLENLIAKKVKANVSSGADIETYASQSINANASSGGRIKIKGDPQEKKIEKSSGGRVKFK